jgi:hypothetical protein
MGFFGALAVAMLSLADCPSVAAVLKQLFDTLQPRGCSAGERATPVPVRNALGILYPHVEQGLFFYPPDRRRAACDC